MYHRLRPSHPFLFFSGKEKKKIVEAIRAAERETSGEIRVHLKRTLKNQAPFESARRMFTQLGMHRTAERNGVLILLGIREKQIMIVADDGIHAKVPDGFWHDLSRKMSVSFMEDRFSEGLLEAIRLAGEELKKSFPRLPHDKNELPDGISYSF